MKKMIDLFAAARRVSVPIVAIRTADQFATVKAIVEQSGGLPVVRWDAAAGMTPANEAGKAELVRAGIAASKTYGFVSALEAALKLNGKTIVCAHNAYRQLHSQEPGQVAGNVQAVANVRDQFKLNYRMLVLLGPTFAPPPELASDIVTLDHELPAPEELATMIKEVHEEGIRGAKAAGTPVTFKAPNKVELARAVDAVCGVPMFAAEQDTAMSLTPAGLDMDALWERKRMTIENTDGLSVYRGRETFADLRGLESVKTRLCQQIGAKTPVGVAVWIDEGADVFANVDEDPNSQKRDQQRALLVEMEQNNWRGMMLIGVPGSGKSAIARAFGNEAGVLTLAVDFGAMENKFVGESEANLRQVLRVVKAVGRGQAFFLLTANSLRGIRPQFQRRFRRGTFFFDLPTAEEREAIWQLYLAKYQIPTKQPRPDDDGWTGAEIRECCESAWDCNTTLADAARFIVPVARSRAREIEEMRRDAHGRFLDASRPGVYTFDEAPMAAQLRAITLASGPGTLQ